MVASDPTTFGGTYRINKLTHNVAELEAKLQKSEESRKNLESMVNQTNLRNVRLRWYLIDTS